MWLKLKVLLWKSLQLRKKHIFGSILEIIVPCLLFLLMAYIKLKLSENDSNSSKTINETIPPLDLETTLTDHFIHSYSDTGYFMYSPSTKEAKNIIDIVAKNLEIPLDAIEAVHSEKEMVTNFKNKFNITANYYSVSTKGFGIVFEDIKSHTFKYKIRSTDDVWLTDMLFPQFEVPGPMDYGQVYIQKGFIALQLALDKAFISLRISNNQNLEDYNLAIQSYPYAKYIMDSQFQQLFQLFFPLFTVLSFLLMISYTVKRIVEEKDTGVKELMKMMGLKSWMIWTGWILHNFFIYIISITIITYLCCFEIFPDTAPLLNYSNPLLYWIFLVLYMISGIFFAFAISSLFNRPLIALIAGSMFWCLSYNLPYTYMKTVKSIPIKILSMALPNVALANGYTAISSLETQGQGLRLSTLFTPGKGDSSFSVGFVAFMFIIDCILYGFIAWYLDSVMPGKYGVAKPFNFFCKWSRKKNENNVMVPITQSNSKFFEKPSNEYEVGIKIQNLHKRFGNCYAVNGVNLDLYKGQITALLGHNGAGKTTTMSIITGLFSPSQGSVEFNGIDLFNNIDYFRENLGLCPQHNLLFSYLTTLDHLKFFGMLKGMPLKKATLEGLNLLKLLNITQKKDNLVSSLSGGMKRKLSLAIALIANPEILILDEPTSGMDPESRREMWDLLLSFRGSRTILITTHFMEEADVLGDRIAIMDHGQVVCYGTSLFLKKAYGTGYNLTIVKDELCPVSNMIKEIKKIIPEAEIQSSLIAQVVINLPNENTDQYPDLFRMLEMNKESFGIKGIGVSCTTMEEVFLKAEKSIQDNDDELSSINTPVDAGYYQLIITKEDGCDVDQVTNLVRQYIPESLLMANTSLQIMYNLPARKRNQFGPLYSALDFHHKNLKLENVKITNPTTGDIYPNSITNGFDGEQQLNNDVTQTLMPKYTNGIMLLMNQMLVLLEKKCLYTFRRWVMTIVFGLGPIFLGLLVMQSTNELFKTSGPIKGLDMSLNTYEGSSVYYRAGDNSSSNLEPKFVALSKKNQATVTEAPSNNYIINDLLEMCNKDVFKYRTNLMIAGDFNQTNSTVIYNNIAIHTPAIGVNLYTNALLQKMSGNDEALISTINEPIQLKTLNKCDMNFGTEIVLLWLTLFTPGFLYLFGYFMALPLSERASGIKQLQMMTKLSPIVYWTTCFLWDYLCYIIVVILTLATMYFFDENHIFTGPNELSVLLTILLIYGWSAIFYTYVYSFFKKTIVSSMLVYISINFIIGTIINNTMFLMKDIIYIDNKTDPYNYWNIARYISLIIPHFSYASCIGGFIEIAWKNNRCKMCKNSDISEACGSNSIDSMKQNYFEFKSDKNKSGILEESLFLLFSSILYIVIVLLFDYKIFARLYQLSFNAIVGSGEGYKDDNEDPDVGGERDKVDAAKTQSDNTSSPLLLVDDLVKKFSFKFTGVRGISFTVSPGECFGLLGVNGAGKTTTFRILTGDILPSKGDASIHIDKEYKMSSNITEYASNIGYCPQFDALNDQLTGRELLKLMAVLRGISPSKTETHVNKWIKLLGLEEYQDRVCGKYSGGNKRKLNTAMALIGDPPVVFLDEPTSGVDPVARRNLWQLLASSQRGGQAVILTSHSMDECEALCNRLTIMVDGVMKCIGNIQYLKNRYGQGFTIMLKLRNAESINITELKSDIERQFHPDINLKDEHKGLLHYHITNPNIPLSDIFGQMKAIKENYSIVEDYTISDTTLEQVFIAFAKKQAVLQQHN